MAGQALEGLKVVECGEFISAAYCAKMMADLGAEVIKIEENGTGDEARRLGPSLMIFLILRKAASSFT